MQSTESMGDPHPRLGQHENLIELGRRLLLHGHQHFPYCCDIPQRTL